MANADAVMGGARQWPTLTGSWAGGGNRAHKPAEFDNFDCTIKVPDFDISSCPIWPKVLLLF